MIFSDGPLSWHSFLIRSFSADSFKDDAVWSLPPTSFRVATESAAHTSREKLTYLIDCSQSRWISWGSSPGCVLYVGSSVVRRVSKSLFFPRRFQPILAPMCSVHISYRPVSPPELEEAQWGGKSRCEIA